PGSPVNQRRVEQRLQPQAGLIDALLRADRHLRLDQIVPGRRNRSIRSRVAPDPARLFHVRDNPRIATATAQAEVEADGTATRPAQRLLAQQLRSLLVL